MAAVKKGNVYYIDIAGNALHLPEYENANIISDLDGMYKMCEEIIPILKERNKLKKALEDEDYTPEEIFAHMKDETYSYRWNTRTFGKASVSYRAICQYSFFI